MEYDILLLTIVRNANDKPAHFHECLGQHLIASYIEQYDFRAKVYYGDVLNCKEVIDREIKNSKIKAIGFYIGADNVVMTGNIIRWIKKNYDIVTIVGGPEAHAVGAEFLKSTYCDYAVYGEGEIPIKNLLTYLLDGYGEINEIKSLKYIDEQGNFHITEMEDIIMDLDSIPFPNKKNSLNKRYRAESGIGILTGRGCPFQCSFCFEGATSKKVRLRSIENVIEEIEEVRKYNRNLTTINIYDDTFTLSKERVKKFGDYMKKSGLRWSCEGHVSRIQQDPDLIRMMVDSGLYAMQIGIESGSQKVLDGFHKKITPDEIIEVVALCQETDLELLEGNYIIGGAFESEETIEESIKHAEKLIEIGGEMLQINTVFFAPYYGTPITKQPSLYGMKIKENEKNHTITTMVDAVVETEDLTTKEIVLAQRKFEEAIAKAYRKKAMQLSKEKLILYRNKQKDIYNQNWKRAIAECAHINEFSKHLSECEQTIGLEKYPIKTIQGYIMEEDYIEKNGFILRGIEKECLLWADGRNSIQDIIMQMGLDIEQCLDIYKKLNEQCLVYFSEF